MKTSVFIVLVSIFLVSCASKQLECLGKTCVGAKEAAGVSAKTKKMYRDIGYRVPTYIPLSITQFLCSAKA